MRAGSRYLVTGGAGFIGSTIARRLLEEDPTAHVRILDNFSTGRRSNLTGIETRVEVVEGDLRDERVVAAAVAGVEYLIHQAAQVSVPRSLEAPEETDAINTRGTLVLLHAARRAGVKRAVIASTCAVYGDNPALPLEESAELRPLSPYAASKLATEAYASVFTRTYGLPTVALRYFNVYGPRQDPNSPYAAVIPLFVRRLIAGEPPVVYGDGRQTRDFVFVDDVARANLLALSDDAPAGAVFNIASGASVSLLELLDTLNRILGADTIPRFAPARPGDIRHSAAGIQQAGDQLRWKPRIGLAEGLHRVIAEHREPPLTTRDRC